MRRKKLWITLSLVNLCIVALLGMTLRTKFLFPIPFIDYKNFLSAHSHFAFGGWVTLTLMVLCIDNLLSQEHKQKKAYQWILWGIELTSLGMAISFPFRGYAFFSILFSTVFIFFTYGFAWLFITDLRKTKAERPVRMLSIVALISLVVSSAGPFTLAYMMATNSGGAFLYRDSIYTYLHFQYNGFFTLTVFALFFDSILKNTDRSTARKITPFAASLSISVLPSLFLSLLWHSYNVYLQSLAIAGCACIIVTLFFFSRFVFRMDLSYFRSAPLAKNLIVLTIISFAIKMLLQVGTIIPSLRNAVFGYRPIIIGFLHLVFLGLVTFYILAELIVKGVFATERRRPAAAITYFAAAIIINETILLVDGIGLMLYSTSRIYPWLLWGAAMLLFSGAVWILTARQRSTPTTG